MWNHNNPRPCDIIKTFDYRLEIWWQKPVTALRAGSTALDLLEEAEVPLNRDRDSLKGQRRRTELELDSVDKLSVHKEGLHRILAASRQLLLDFSYEGHRDSLLIFVQRRVQMQDFDYLKQQNLKSNLLVLHARPVYINNSNHDNLYDTLTRPYRYKGASQTTVYPLRKLGG